MTAPRPHPPEVSFTREAAAWGGVALLLAGVGWAKGINLLLLVGYFLIGLLAVNLAIARVMVGRVAGRRRPLGPVFAGERVGHVVEVTNPSDRPAAVLVADPAGDAPARWLLPTLPGRAAEVLRTPVTFPTRGLHPVGPLVAESGYPFGLVRWVRPVAAADRVAVLPAVGKVDVGGLRRFVARAGGGDGRSRRPSRRPTAGLGDVRGVRPYRPGDSPRDVHWKTTARRGQLVSREYDQTDPLHLAVVVDPWASATWVGSAAAGERVDWVAAVAVAIGAAWAAADEPGGLTLVLPGRPPAVVAADRVSVAWVRQAFAPLAALAEATDVPEVPADAVRPAAAGTARLVVSTRPDSPLAAALRRAGLPTAEVDPGADVRWYTPARVAASRLTPFAPAAGGR